MWRPHDTSYRVAKAKIRADLLKAWFIANARLLLVLLSGAMLGTGILLAATNIRLEWSMQTLQLLIINLPIAIIAGLVAVSVEGGTLFASAMLQESRIKIRQELVLLDKVASKFSEEQLARKRRQIKRQGWPAYIILAVCMLFSTIGSLIFWNEVLQAQGLFLHIIGDIMGLTCSALLTIFEMNNALADRVIERAIASSALIAIALEQSARQQIHDTYHERRSHKLRSAEFTEAIDAAAEQSLYGVLEEALHMAGASVGQEQLRRAVEEERAVIEEADRFLASQGKDTAALADKPELRLLPSGRRQTKERKASLAIIRKYGVTRVLENIDAFAEEANISPTTLRRHATEAANSK